MLTQFIMKHKSESSLCAIDVFKAVWKMLNECENLDEAKKNFPLKIHNGMMIVDTRETQAALKFDEIGKWFIENFGEN